MTYHEFLDRLAKLRQFKWFLANHQIRAWQRNAGEEYCPITAVAEVVTGEFYGLGEYREAASALGLAEKVASGIVDAADNDCGEFIKRHRQRVKIIRAQLLQITGLAR